MERVLAEKLRGPETTAEVTAPVPFPVRRPPKVVEPVPPKEVATVVVAMTPPVELVKRRALVIEEIANFEVVAVVEVPLPIVRLSMMEGVLMVEEAYRAVLYQVGVVVALVLVPYVEVMVQGQVKVLAEVR
jgi:hypothetical protein